MQKITKNNIRILKIPHANLQSISKAPVKFQRDQLNTVEGVTRIMRILPTHSSGIIALKRQEMQKMIKKNISGF